MADGMGLGVIGDTFVKYDAHTRHILVKSTSMKLEGQFRNANCLKFL